MREKDRNRIVQEVNILHELHHPNIVKYYVLKIFLTNNLIQS